MLNVPRGAHEITWSILQALDTTGIEGAFAADNVPQVVTYDRNDRDDK
jgi:hypothetical protein